MIAKICCCLLALLVYVQYLLYLMHMFQLNTYKNNEQSAWNKKIPPFWAATLFIWR